MTNRQIACILLGAALFVAALWVGSLAVVVRLFPDWPTRGQFGDLFGAVNSLFSGLAFAGVIIAILLQREELRLQREEMAASRKQLAEQAKAQRANVQAVITQLKISAIQTEVRALEMESLQKIETARKPWVEAIRANVNKMETLIETLERSQGPSSGS